MATTPRARARAQTMDEIVRIGRRHLATDGAAGLSLRAIARDLGVVSSAVYRYVQSRDELLTLLIVEGYDELSRRVEDAVAEVPTADPRGRLGALGRAVRTWARAEPATYALLFGSPVPGYRAPEERTVAAGTRVPRLLMSIVSDAYAAGRIDIAAHHRATGASATPALVSGFEEVREAFGIDLPDDVVATGVLVWSALFGCVSFEVFGQYGADAMGDPDALFELQVTRLADLLCLP
ncbi:TetR/AcrR family transcriptional regulator [Nocardioides insulae]|uniref:TetR/AcrR family transcriptional regulator n=1 Tax=Nocardioides insulae TaxID=394734 RepID=UPI0004235E97|nr:TetR/AcrR family transcriptional regulator [Nocardioides insulae]